jgi:hypothetical protein
MSLSYTTPNPSSSRFAPEPRAEVGLERVQPFDVRAQQRLHLVEELPADVVARELLPHGRHELLREKNIHSSRPHPVSPQRPATSRLQNSSTPEA